MKIIRKKTGLIKGPKAFICSSKLLPKDPLEHNKFLQIPRFCGGKLSQGRRGKRKRNIYQKMADLSKAQEYLIALLNCLQRIPLYYNNKSLLILRFYGGKLTLLLTPLFSSLENTLFVIRLRSF